MEEAAAAAADLLLPKVIPEPFPPRSSEPPASKDGLFHSLSRQRGNESLYAPQEKRLRAEDRQVKGFIKQESKSAALSVPEEPVQVRPEDFSLYSTSSQCTPRSVNAPLGGPHAGSSSAKLQTSFHSSCSTATTVPSAQAPLFPLQPRRSAELSDSIQIRCTSPSDQHGADEYDAEDTSAEQKTALDTEGAVSLPFCWGSVTPVCIKWFGASSVLQSCRKLICNTIQGLLVMLLRMQRKHLLHQWPDLMERYTHDLSEGLLRSERHSVQTADGYEIHFYRLRKVTRCCCRSGCACAAVGFSAGTAEALEAAAADAAAAVAREAARSTSHTWGSNSIPGGDLDGQVFFFQHGLLESSLNWITGGWLSLPFIVAAKGGEVWLANSRGNEYTRPVKQHEQQPLQHPGAGVHSSAAPCAQGRETNQNGFSLFTLHSFIAEQHSRLEALKELRQAGGGLKEQQPQDQQSEDDSPEEECCSFFCCHCSGLTSLPYVLDKPLEQQLHLLQKAFTQASFLLLRLQCAGRRACEPREQQQQQQRMHAAANQERISVSCQKGFCSTESGENTGEPSAPVRPESPATAKIPCTSLPRPEFSNIADMGAGATKESTASASFGGSTCDLPSSCGEMGLLLGDEADAGCTEESFFPEEGSKRSLRCEVIDQADERDAGMSTNSFRWRRVCSRRLHANNSKNRHVEACRVRNIPPFEFCQDSAEGPWSFHEMAMYDCPAQLQYIAMNSPTLKRHRASAFAAAASIPGGSSSSSPHSPFSCGLVAVGQSQGAAQLLVALSTSPSLGLLAPRVVLFSPPLILQPLKELPRAALLLMQLGLRYPTVLLKALRSVVGFIPGKVLALVGNAVVGTGRPGSMHFYSTPLQLHQLALNFAYTPSGGTSRQNFVHWLQQLQKTQPLSTLSDTQTHPEASLRNRSLSLFETDEKDGGADRGGQQPEFEHVVDIHTVDGDSAQQHAELPELKLPQGRYPLERIRSEVFAFLGSKDNLVATEASAKYLEGCIAKGRLHLCVKSGFGHLDFGWGRDRASDLYPQLLARLVSNSPSACNWQYHK